jgi:hypothetical protein
LHLQQLEQLAHGGVVTPQPQLEGGGGGGARREAKWGGGEEVGGGAARSVEGQGWHAQAGEGAVLEAREGVILETLLTPLAAVLQPARSGARCRLLRLNWLPHAPPDSFAMARAARALSGGTQCTCFTRLL